MKAPLGCGVVDHPETCLCDVKPLEVRIAVSDGVNEMWMGRRLCDVGGHAGPWTRNRMLDYFEDLCKFYDRWAEARGMHQFPEYLYMLTMPEGLRDGGFGNWYKARDFVNSAYHYYGCTMLEVLDAIGMTTQEWYEINIGGRINSGLVFTPPMLKRIENLFTEPTTPNLKALEAETGISDHVLRNWRDTVFGPRRKKLHGDETPEMLKASAAEMLKQLALESDDPPRIIMQKVREATGIEFSNSYVTQIRKRNNRKTPI